MTPELEPEGWQDQFAWSLLMDELGEHAGPVEGAHARFNAYVKDVERVGLVQARLERTDKSAGDDQPQQGE